MFTTRTLRDRGWNPTLIEKYLGEPDGHTTNPHVSTAAPMRLWRNCRVLEAEMRPDFVRARDKALQRAAARQQCATARHTALQRRAAAMPIAVEQRNAGWVVYASLRAVCSGELHEPFDPAAEGATGVGMADRIGVQFVRCRLTRYDRNLEAEAATAGFNDLVHMIRHRVLGEIATVYPHLGAECERQMAASQPQSA